VTASPTLRHLALTEQQTVPTDLTAEDLAFLRGPHGFPKKALRVSNDGSGWHLRAGPYVGVFQLPSMTVQVRPKGGVSARTLLYMLLRASQVKQLPLPAAPLQLAETDLQEELARIFLQALSAQLERGVLRQYRLVQDNVQAMRGRLRVAAYIRRTDPARLPVEYSDLTADHAVNRMFLLTLTRLARWVRVPANIRQVARLRGWLQDAGVTPLRERPRRGPAFALNRLSRRYQEALDLAWLLLEGLGALQDAGSRWGEAFTFNMDRLYEKFLERVICEDILSGSGYCPQPQTLKPDSKYLFQNNVQKLKPDLTIFRETDAHLIVDFKNKSFGRKPPEEQDLYQMYSYARHLSCPQVLLLYPGTGQMQQTLTTTNAPPLSITAATVDLTRELPEHLDQLRAELRALLQKGLTV